MLMKPGGLLLITAPAVEPVTTAEAKAQMRVDITDDDTYIAAIVKSARKAIENITGQKLISQVWQYWLDRYPGNYGDFPPPGLGYVFMPAYSFNAAPGTMPLVMGTSDFNTISLPLGPVTAINELKYYDTAGTGTVWASTNYIADTISLPARLVKKDSATWPIPALGLQEVNAVAIKFTCGYLASSTLDAARADMTAAEALVSAASTAGEVTAAKAALAAAQVALTAAETAEINAVPEDLKHAIKLLAAHFYMNREAVTDIKFEDLPFGIQQLITPYRMWQAPL